MKFLFASPTPSPTPTTTASPDSCEANLTFALFSHRVVIEQPTLVPLCLLAALIGVTGFLQVRKSARSLSNPMYAWSFLFFAIMMSFAMLVNCFTRMSSGSTPTLLDLVLMVFDAGFTSGIAVSLFLNGLIDVKILSPASRLTHTLFVVDFVGCFTAWALSIVLNWSNCYVYLYVVLIGICGVCFGVCEVVWFCRSGSLRGAPWAAAAATAGGLGQLVISDARVAAFFCTYLGPRLSPWFGPSAIWFAVSDIAVICAVQYVLTRDQRTTAVVYKLLSVPQSEDVSSY